MQKSNFLQVDDYLPEAIKIHWHTLKLNFAIANVLHNSNETNALSKY